MQFSSCRIFSKLNKNDNPSASASLLLSLYEKYLWMQNTVTVLFISNRAALPSPWNSFKMIHVGIHSLHDNCNPKCYLLWQIWAELLQQLMFQTLVEHTANRVLLQTVQLLCRHNLCDIHILKWSFIYNFRQIPWLNQNRMCRKL